MSSQAFIVDAFTHGELKGNPAAVVLLDESRNAEWMQAAAAEFNQAETAFLSPGEGDDHWQLRWFTPVVEIDLCGHATLASAHVLWQHLNSPAQTLRFATRSGELRAARADGRVRLDFPRCALSPIAAPDLPHLFADLQAQDAVLAGDDLLLVLPEPAAVRNFQPDIEHIARLPWRGLIITAACLRGEVDFVSRFFVPRIGVAEDPVTGAVHCALTPYWSERLGKQSLVAEQWSARGGRLHLKLAGERVHLAGNARTFLSGTLHG